MNVNQSDLIKARTDLGSFGGGEYVCECLGGVHWSRGAGGRCFVLQVVPDRQSVAAG